MFPSQPLASNFPSFIVGAYIGSGKVSTIDTNGKIVTTDRTWERIHSYNLGVDFAFLNNRLTGTFELFMKKNYIAVFHHNGLLHFDYLAHRMKVSISDV